VVGRLRLDMTEAKKELELKVGYSIAIKTLTADNAGRTIFAAKGGPLLTRACELLFDAVVSVSIAYRNWWIPGWHMAAEIA